MVIINTTYRIAKQPTLRPYVSDRSHNLALLSRESSLTDMVSNKTQCVFCAVVFGFHNETIQNYLVGTATRYGMDGPGIESRWVARFSVSVQTGPGAHPASYIMGTGCFPGVTRTGFK